MNVEPLGGTTRIHLPATPTVAQTWWDAYASHLESIGPTSRGVIEEDARFIVEHGVLGDGNPAEGGWPLSRQRSGLVMGAVQSGKTASMMAVTAIAFDRGVDAVILLGGTRTALWKQTYERLTDQLAFSHDAHKRRLLVPRQIPEDPDIDVLYRIGAPVAVRRAVEQRKPTLAVVMKNWAHLQRMAAAMKEVYAEAARQGGPFQVLVIDDEADDSSVIDADAEAAGAAAGPKQVPRRIVDLWEDRSRAGETVNEHVFATYLAYTATPQANFLQDDQNPLAPRHFVASLRTPGAEGVTAVRTSTYRVPEGLGGWYTGGDVYYKTLADARLCMPTDAVPDQEQVPDAVRAFLVASAVRLMRANDRFGPLDARGTRFTSEEEAKRRSPQVASMLVHPSSGLEDHFKVAQELLQWASGTENQAGSSDVDTRIDRQLGGGGIAADMTTNKKRWFRWLDEYSDSAQVVAGLPGAGPCSVPGQERWPEVRALILEQIVPATTVRVINSHEDADDRPQYFPAQEEDGTWSAAQNLSTIFVSGNVMSRGLTLEGLTTTLFTRRSGVPFADTQMQMQRWFGYRGAYIDLCRVFMPQDVLEQFVSYHEDDEALRRDVLARMEAKGTLPDVSVLQGRSYLATGKIANVRSRPLFPGPRPFISHMNPEGNDETNLSLIAESFRGSPQVVGKADRPRGLVLPEPLGLLDAAALLDGIRYVDHGPGADGPEAERWRSVENHAELGADPVSPLYRAPEVADSFRLGEKSPYWIAAYLRFWHACLVRRVPAAVTTGELPTRWDLVDLSAKSSEQPRFWVGLRFGDGSVVEEGPLVDLSVPVRSMRRTITSDGRMATWGSRGRGADGVIKGDALFDYTARREQPNLTPDGDRRPGEDGLILFHPIERSPGRVTLAVGLSIPLGGPNQIQAATGRV